MSGGKGNGVPHQVLDTLRKFEAQWVGKQNEMIKKHNDQQAQIAALEAVIKNVATFAATEVAKANGTAQRQIHALMEQGDKIDMNVLVLAELAKEMIGQLTQIDALFQRLHEGTKKALGPPTTEALQEFDNALELAEADVAKIKEDATNWYHELVASSFKVVRQRLTDEAKAREEKATEQAKAAKEAAEKAQAALDESQRVESELKKAAEGDRSLTPTTSGGPGTVFPEGADIFGG